MKGTALTSFDLLGTGSQQLITGWESGKVNTIFDFCLVEVEPADFIERWGGASSKYTQVIFNTFLKYIGVRLMFETF